MDSIVEPAVCESRLCRVPAGASRASYVTSLCVSFLLCDMSSITPAGLLGGLNAGAWAACGTAPSAQMELRHQLVSFCVCRSLACSSLSLFFSSLCTLLMSNISTQRTLSEPQHCARTNTALGSLLAFREADANHEPQQSMALE